MPFSTERSTVAEYEAVCVVDCGVEKGRGESFGEGPFGAIRQPAHVTTEDPPIFLTKNDKNWLVDGSYVAAGDFD
jgi:hypothetical protein